MLWKDHHCSSTEKAQIRDKDKRQKEAAIQGINDCSLNLSGGNINEAKRKDLGILRRLNLKDLESVGYSLSGCERLVKGRIQHAF